MRSLYTTLLAALAAAATTAAAALTPTPRSLTPGLNKFDCRSGSHPNPVILLHGLGATDYEDLNVLQYHLQAHDYCTFAKTYGAYDGFPFLGGLKPINESAGEIADYVLEVKEKTGAAKVDLVGHSEGALQTLYVPKFEEKVRGVVQRLVAIAPPTHGTSFAGLYKLAIQLGNTTKAVVDDVLDTVGCQACTDLVTGGEAIQKLNQGPILQEGTSLTVIVSKTDELVTPYNTSIVREDGVDNVLIQNTCPLDAVGHIGEAYDPNVWNLVQNALDDKPDRKFPCVVGAPLKRR